MTQDSITISQTVSSAVSRFECVAWLQRFTGDYELSAVASGVCVCVRVEYHLIQSCSMRVQFSLLIFETQSKLKS